jgi:hypothetical protein
LTADDPVRQLGLRPPRHATSRHATRGTLACALLFVSPIMTTIRTDLLAQILGGAQQRPVAPAPAAPSTNNNIVVAPGAAVGYDSHAAEARNECYRIMAKQYGAVRGYLDPVGLQQYQKAGCR